MIYNCIIIGGGISGLTSAFLLCEKGYKPLIIEKGDFGGHIRSDNINGFTLELGANTFADTPNFGTLLEKLGLTSLVREPVLSKFKQYVWHKGKAFAVPKSPLALLGTPLLSFSEKLRVGRALFSKIPKETFSQKRSVFDLFSSIFSESICLKVIDPALRGIFGGDIYKLNAWGVFPKLFAHLDQGGSIFEYASQKKALGKRRIFCLAGGNYRLCDTLLKRVNALGSIVDDTVIKIVRDEGTQNYKVETLSGASFYTRAVVIATSGEATATYIKGLSLETASLLQTLRYAPIIVIHCDVPKREKLLDNGFGVLFPSTTASGLLGILFNSNLFPHVSPPNRHLLTVCFGGVERDNMIALSDDELKSLCLKELNEHLCITDVHLLSIYRWQKAIPQYEENYSEILKAQEAFEQNYPGIFFIGADRGGVGVPDRIECAFESSEKILGFCFAET